MIANLFKDPTRHVHGIDIAGAGLNIETLILNEMGDQIALQYSDPGFLNHARTGIFRRNILDTQLLPREYYDGGTMILTLFTVPLESRPTALLNAYQSLKPGAPFTIVEPIAKVHNETSARQFLRDIVGNAYKNNPDLTHLDVALLAVKNAQQLLKSSTQFLPPDGVRKMIEDAGFVVKKVTPAFYGATNKLDLEKPEK